MSLVPKVKICIASTCDKINIYEETGSKNPNNLSGWGNTNPNTDDIWESKVEIFNYNKEDLIETVFLKNQQNLNKYSPVIGSPTPGNFLAIKNHEWNQEDGVFSIKYTVDILLEEVEGEPPILSTYYNEPQKVLFTCNLEFCINNLKQIIVTECDFKQISKIKTKIDQLEIIFYGIKSAFACNDIETTNQLLEQAKIICENLCHCGCGNC